MRSQRPPRLPSRRWPDAVTGAGVADSERGVRVSIRDAGFLAGAVIVCQLAGATGALVTDAGWYRELVRPAWAPPGWLFGPVWITLYTMMGVAVWLAWRGGPGPGRRDAMTWFAVQLALNAVWTPVFFGLRSLVGGLAVIVVLGAAIVATIRAVGRRSRVGAWLLVPYAAWVAFATILTATLVGLNA